MATEAGPGCTQFSGKKKLQMSSTLSTEASHWAQETVDPSRESIGNCMDFSPHTAVLRRLFFCRICNLSAVWFFRALSEEVSTSLRRAVDPMLGTPLEDQFKTNWREGLSCSPIQLFQHFI